jgi:hypothetical protein
MSPLERRCRLLLRAYQAPYREVRGEEIIGTLLEATPPGRSWPLPRDIRCLIAGGLRARAAQPRQFTTATNLRVAALAGLAAYLTYSASAILSDYVRADLMSGQLSAPAGWPLATVVLPLITMALAWRSRRRLIVLVGTLPAAAAIIYAGPWQGLAVGFSVVRLACLAVLVALAGYAERPGWRWCWPLGLLAIAPLPLAAVTGRFAGVYLVALALAVGVLSIAGIVIDARPAIAMAAFLAAIQLPITIGFLSMGAGFQLATVYLLVVMAVLAVAVWRLRRQSARTA